ncbi:MAG: hypothetical protein M1818_006019 [Claussenomyces sp. TS43310]|nr:MAG: hypothetical protein M1818_006019 [Claussenomyces sp. TS43310]
MPPKGSGRRRAPYNGLDNSTEEVYDIISLGDTSDNSSVVMTGRRPVAHKGRKAVAPSVTRRGGRSAQSAQTAVPEVYHDLLAETLHSSGDVSSERSPKRRRTRRFEDGASTDDSRKISDQPVRDIEDSEMVEFEDVLPRATEQTAYRDSDEDSEGSDIGWEEVDMVPEFLQADNDEDISEDLHLTLNSSATPQRKPAPPKRKLTSADRALCLEIHKMHILCLLSHTSRRNVWCDDSQTQSALKILINKKTLSNLRPSQALSQFRQTDLLKTGLEELCRLWRSNFVITARGMRRPLWVEDEQDLKDFQLPPDIDPPIKLDDFRAAARTLKGSRDLGAQLFCALLRSAGLETRLVHSLQPLPFSATAKTIAPASSRPSPLTAKTPTPDISEDDEVIDVQGQESPFAQGGSATSDVPFSARRRLGHPNAADYQIPSVISPSKPAVSKPKRRQIHESPYPVYWVEVLDEAHQKWMPVDPLVTGSVAKVRLFEPPGSDEENAMSYVMGFEDDEIARDVTRRYAKAYNSKTRKWRVEATDGGQRWWTKAMRHFRRDWQRDLDQIEDSELAALEAREPMPKSIADFKGHPSYALERHLRKNEVLINRHEIGKVAAGRDPSVSGGKRMESVYRRSAVQTARSADRWYRLGRDVKVGEQPVKLVAARSKEEHADEEAGVGLYTESQTEIYKAPPVIDGRVPRNAFGNLDVYVNSMIPRGGVHISYEEAASAARLVGVDYADAVTGFKFEGRRGRPVVNGIIVAAEFKEAIEAVVEGFRDERARMEEEMRSLAALRMWKKFIAGLRIKERVDAYEVDGEDVSGLGIEEDEEAQSEEYKDDGGGGFFPE